MAKRENRIKAFDSNWQEFKPEEQGMLEINPSGTTVKVIVEAIGETHSDFLDSNGVKYIRPNRKFRKGGTNERNGFESGGN